MKKLRAISIMICQSILVISVMACTGERDKKQTNTDAVPVTVGKVRKVQERETISVSGTVSAPDSPAVVSFLVSGKVIFVGPREGEYVRKGQVLAQIDPTDFRLSLKIAEAQKDSAHAALEKAMNSARPELLEQARIAYERAEEENRRIVLDLKDVKLVDRDAVRFLARCEANGTRLENCPAYIREWIVREGPPMEPA